MGIKHRNKIILGIGLGMFVAVIVAGYLPKAHSFSGFKGKTLWDWLSLAGVPSSLAGLGFWLQLQQQKQNDLQKQRELEQTQELAAIEQEQTEKLAAVEREIAEQNRQEEALQNYYDKVSALLVDKNLLAIAAKGDTATPEEKELLGVSVDVIRARTLTTLRRLDSTRKTSLIRFLLEADVISKLQLSLKDANLSGVNLSIVDLRGAILYGADLSNANLSGAALQGAILFNANLSNANFLAADLSNARLGGAILSFANLKFADLPKAIGLTKEQLEGKDPPYLCRTQLPEDIDIDPDRDCERLKRDLS